MNIKNIVSAIEELSIEDITKDDFIKNILYQKGELSKSDVRYLSKKIGKFRGISSATLLKYIILFSFWQADEAIDIARKKGVFRYKAWGFQKNEALYLLENINKYKDKFAYSAKTKKFITSKIQVSWMYDFYKKTERKIIDYIKQHHQNRSIHLVNGIRIEEALFKELLAYIDVMFHFPSRNHNPRNKNKLDGYGMEQIAESVSYKIYLYDDVIGIQQDKVYKVVPEYVLSDEIENIILLGCKIAQLQEWEVCMDYFDYQLQKSDRVYTLSACDEYFEKSIRLGFVRSQMQEEVLYIKEMPNLKDVPAISEFSNFAIEKLGNLIIKTKGKGKEERYVIEFPELLIEAFKGNNNGFFREEILEIAHCAKELVIPSNELLLKKITKNCTLQDVLLLKRLFVIMDSLAEELMFKQKNQEKIVNSLIPGFRKEILSDLLYKFIGDNEKVEEMLQLFTYEKSVKLDLQYTPFLTVGNNLLTSISLAAKSNLLRNCIAYSYLTGNQIVNKDDKEWLVEECKQIFTTKHPEYSVFTNVSFTYNKQHGEIDALIIADNDIFIIECKCPLQPTNNFELRASYDHIIKASKQLDNSKMAFEDDLFRKNYLKGLGILDKKRIVHTCILMGNRLFNGYSINNHPVRYVHELDMILNNGHIDSEIGVWRVWENEKFSNDDLLAFLSPDCKLAKSSFSSMHKVNEFMFVDGKKVIFETYIYNILDSIKQYDECFIIEERDEEKFQNILNHTQSSETPFK